LEKTYYLYLIIFNNKQNKTTATKPYKPSSTMKISYPLILANVFLVSFLDPISAMHVICLSDSDTDVDAACAGETFSDQACGDSCSIHDEFESRMEAAFQRGTNRNLQSDDKRELQSASNCAYCQQYPEKWCESYPYTECNRILHGNPHTMTEAQCVNMVSAADTVYETLQNEAANQTCIDALQSIECSCDTD
jgi:hypothetical protein